MNIIIAVLLIFCMLNMAMADLNVTQEKNGAYLIVATHPVKPLDMIELPIGNSTVKKIFDNAEVIVETIKIQNRTGMNVQAIAGESDSNVTYLRIYKHIIDTQWDYPQIFVLHANGYAQITPQPPVGIKKVKFGPPIVFGPAIKSVVIDPPSLSMEIRYEDKTGANVKIIKVDRKQNIIEYANIRVYVSVKSTPDSAWIWLNGKNMSKKTNNAIPITRRGDNLFELKNDNKICSKKIPINKPRTNPTIECKMAICDFTINVE